MRILRFFGWIFALVALMALVHDAWAALQGGPLHLSAVGELWFKYDVGSLNQAQAGVQRHFSPELWDNWVRPYFLLQPALLVFGVLALVFLAIGRRGRRR